MIRTLIILLLFTLCWNGLLAQSSLELSKDTVYQGIGAELKGLYIGGTTTFLLGFGVTEGLHSTTEYYEKFAREAFIGGMFAAVTGSALSVTIGSLFGKNHSPKSGRARLGSGIILNNHRFRSEKINLGLHLRLLTPAVGHWRYAFDFNKYFGKEYTSIDERTYRDWELNINLMYRISLTKVLEIYPSMGANFIRRITLIHEPFRENNRLTNAEAGGIIGLGSDIRLTNKWYLNNEFSVRIYESGYPVYFSTSVYYQL